MSEKEEPDAWIKSPEKEGPVLVSKAFVEAAENMRKVLKLHVRLHGRESASFIRSVEAFDAATKWEGKGEKSI